MAEELSEGRAKSMKNYSKRAETSHFMVFRCDLGMKVMFMKRLFSRCCWMHPTKCVVYLSLDNDSYR